MLTQMAETYLILTDFDDDLAPTCYLYLGDTSSLQILLAFTSFEVGTETAF